MADDLHSVATQKSRDGVTALVALDEDTIVVARRTTGLVVWKVIIGAGEAVWVQHAVISAHHGLDDVWRLSDKQVIYRIPLHGYYIYDVDTEEHRHMPVITGPAVPVRRIVDVHSGLIAVRGAAVMHIFTADSDQQRIFAVICGATPENFACVILSNRCVVCCNLSEPNDRSVRFRVYGFLGFLGGARQFIFSDDAVWEDNGFFVKRINDTRFAMSLRSRDVEQIWVFDIETELPEPVFSMSVNESCQGLAALDDHTLVGTGHALQLFAWEQPSDSRLWDAVHDHYTTDIPYVGYAVDTADVPGFGADRQFGDLICKMSETRFVVGISRREDDIDEIVTVVVLETGRDEPLRQYALRAASTPTPHRFLGRLNRAEWFIVFKFIVSHEGYWAPYPSFEALMVKISEYALVNVWGLRALMTELKIHLPQELQDKIVLDLFKPSSASFSMLVL